MKMLLSVLAALGVGFAGAYVLTSNQAAALRAEHAKQEAQWQSEKDELESALAKAKRQSVRVETVEKDREIAVSARRSAADILANLLTIKPAGATRIPAIRKIVHELEDLVELKIAAVPAIQTFLAQNTDIDYSVENSDREDRGGRDRWTAPWSRRSPPTEFSLPPSLRIGLFDVLKEISGPEAEQALAEVLGTTGRAVEVAYLARALEAMTPGKYCAISIDAAKSLLRNPLAMESPSRLDESGESYLYGVLEMCGDKSFADEAGNLLVTNGQLDRNARDYLLKTKGEEAIPALLDAYKNGNFSNNWDKASLASRVLDYVGSNKDANNLLNDIITNPELDFRPKIGAIFAAVGMGRDEKQKTPEQLTAVGQVLQAINGGIPDTDPIKQPINRIIGKINNGEPLEWDRGPGRREGGSSNNGNNSTSPQ